MNISETAATLPALEKISIADDCELDNWSKKFGITPDKLKIAVIEVGTGTKNLEQFIRTHLFQ